MNSLMWKKNVYVMLSHLVVRQNGSKSVSQDQNSLAVVVEKCLGKLKPVNSERLIVLWILALMMPKHKINIHLLYY